MITRGKLSHQDGIKGNGCTNCLTSAFCGCCALVQEEKEVKAATNGIRAAAVVKRILRRNYAQ